MSSLTEEDNARCWEYVMKFSLDEIHNHKGSEMNHKCSEHIKNKESFMHYVEDKRSSIRIENKIDSDIKEPPPILGRNFIRKSS
jgi:hypothetical protein